MAGYGTISTGFQDGSLLALGKSGTGKSRWAFDNTEMPYYKDPNTKWWCGYAGQMEVIIDDYRPSKEMPFNFMLALFDRYPMQIQSKHGNHQFVSKRIFITSPKDVDSTLTDLDWLGVEEKFQFKRRITKELHFTPSTIVQELVLPPLTSSRTIPPPASPVHFIPRELYQLL